MIASRVQLRPEKLPQEMSRQEPSTQATSRQTMSLRIPLAAGWEMASVDDPRTAKPSDTKPPAGLRFIPAQVPGTVASALRAQGLWHPGHARSLDASEHWFRCRFEAEAVTPGEEVVLELGGIATLSEIWLNGRHILESCSMFESHRLEVSSLLRANNELVIVCRSLSAATKSRRTQSPHARWRTRLVCDQQLRWIRTTLLGRAPGFAPEPAPVGPWRPVMLIRARDLALEHWSCRAELDGTAGVVRAELKVRELRPDARPLSGRLTVGEWHAPVEWEPSAGLHFGRASLRLPEVRPWWPHTHGEPALYPVSVEVQLEGGRTVDFDATPVGFRSIRFDTDRPGRVGFEINGVPVFARGVIWTPPDPIAFTNPESSTRQRLEFLRDAGFNLIRLAGTAVYEEESFHRLCDELGFLVWQDMMFANMDYPFADAAFWDTARAEAERELKRVVKHPSTALICGNSEIEQQAGMLGLDAALGRGPFFGEELPRMVASCCPGVSYLPSAPSGGDQPFRTNTGVANYFGVSAYLRPLEDARRAGVRFASECLAFSNIPEPELIDEMALATPGGISPDHPAWKRAVPRDAGVGWDFEDVRDHYLKLLYSVDPMRLRYTGARRYWELSRMVSGEVMAEVFGEWRRPQSTCGGGIILWGADLEPGAGWGILDSCGQPKAAYWFLKRALAPCAVWTTDEGLNGVDVHVSNDGSASLDALLRVALYAHGEQKIAEVHRTVSIGARSSATFGVEEALGRFVDASYAYRFGPPGHDLIAVSLHRAPGDPAFAQSFRFPAGRTAQRCPIAELGFTAEPELRADGSLAVLLSASRFANGVRVTAVGALPDDCYFGIEPAGTRRIVLTPLIPGARPTGLTVTAVNAEGRLSVSMDSRS